MRRLVLLSLLLLSGCVYYNGMYNTKRLAGSARRAEREGRPFEANNLWGQVVTRADSLVVRHPASKYVEQALVYKGIALARLGQCPTAVPALARAGVTELDGEIAEEASLALGRCHLELGDPGAAGLAFARLLESGDGVRRREARLLYARALRQTGRPEEALGVLDDLTDARAAPERLFALAAAHRDGEAVRLADSLIGANDSARVWDSVLSVVGSTNPTVASALVDLLGARQSTERPMHARRLLEDAERLVPIDTARATARLAEVARMEAGGISRERAALLLLRRRIRGVRHGAELRLLVDTARALVGRTDEITEDVELLAGRLALVLRAQDSSGPDVPQGDLRLFLAAETARDSLQAPPLAATLFRQLVETWPDSPYAPKALLAGSVLDSVWGEQVRPLLDERYATSPYLSFLRGGEPLGYRALEDSLHSYALAQSSAQARRRPPASVRRTPEPDRDGQTPGRRPGRPPRGIEQ